ncbi:hypothetical protein ACHAQJ_006197 [Trichoderma viride]
MDTSTTKRSASGANFPSPPKAPLSLYDIARRYCREGIIVQPLNWTGRHLELLQCSFGKLSYALPTMHSNSAEEDSGTRGELVTSESKLPIAAYIDRDHVQHRRRETLRQYMSRRSNVPIKAIWRSKWNKIDPTEPLHDPYIVALLIAMAQQHQIFHRMKPKKEATLITTFPVCLN